jgi:hypothetical protein
VQVKNLVSRKIVKELVMKDVTPARGGTEEWCPEEELCLETQCKLEGMKVRALKLIPSPSPLSTPNGNLCGYITCDFLRLYESCTE